MKHKRLDIRELRQKSAAYIMRILPQLPRPHLVLITEITESRRGSFDFSRIVDVLLIVVLMPTLINVMSSLTGGALGEFSGIFSAFMQILPIVVILDLFTDMIGGAGGSTFKKIFEVIKIIIILPILLNMLSGFLGTSLGGLSTIVDVFVQILPIVVLIDLFTDLVK